MEQKKHDAMHGFSLLSDGQQKSVIRFVENAKTGEDAKNRIEEAVQRLENGDAGPFL